MANSSGRRKRFTRPTPFRQPGRRGAAVRVATAAVLLIGAGAVVARVPPFLQVGRRMAEALTDALYEGRRAEARHAMVAASAARYRIAPDLAREIERAAVDEGIDPDLAFRLVQVESSFRERAVSPAGAMGLTQLMPATAAWLQPGITEEEIFDRTTNLRLGFRYLRMLLTSYDGRVEEALHAYNRGPGTVDRIRAAGGDPANGYADRVLGPLEGEIYTGSGFLAAPAGDTGGRPASE